jgi:hypothetical protein
MTDGSRSDPSLQALLAEFTALRQEIVDLSARRQTILLYQMTSAGALFSFSLSGKNRTLFLLIIPIITYLCYARYVMMRDDVSRIARYIQEELSPRTPEGLNWGSWNRVRHKFDFASTPLPPTFIAFPGVSTLALAATVTALLGKFRAGDVGQGTALSAVWIIGAALTAFIAYRVWVNSVLPYLHRDQEQLDSSA